MSVPLLFATLPPATLLNMQQRGRERALTEQEPARGGIFSRRKSRGPDRKKKNKKAAVAQTDKHRGEADDDDDDGSSQATTSPNSVEDGVLPTSSEQGPLQLGFSFAGGGWLMVYMFGVAKALRAYGVHHQARFIGTSAGALASIGLTLDADFDAICDTVISSYVPRAHRSLRGPFRMREYLVDALTKHANLDDFERCNDDPTKCTIVYTSLSAWTTRRKSSFKSRDHLLKTLIASCCATPVVGLPFRFEGEWVMDGGILDNQPMFEDANIRTITISPNAESDADIRPSQDVPMRWTMYPPSQRELRWVYELGINDGGEWCQHEGYEAQQRTGTMGTTSTRVSNV